VGGEGFCSQQKRPSPKGTEGGGKGAPKTHRKLTARRKKDARKGNRNETLMLWKPFFHPSEGGENRRGWGRLGDGATHLWEGGRSVPLGSGKKSLDGKVGKKAEVFVENTYAGTKTIARGGGGELGGVGKETHRTLENFQQGKKGRPEQCSRGKEDGAEKLGEGSVLSVGKNRPERKDQTEVLC